MAMKLLVVSFDEGKTMRSVRVVANAVDTRRHYCALRNWG